MVYRVLIPHWSAIWVTVGSTFKMNPAPRDCLRLLIMWMSPTQLIFSILLNYWALLKVRVNKLIIVLRQCKESSYLSLFWLLILGGVTSQLRSSRINAPSCYKFFLSQLVLKVDNLTSYHLLLSNLLIYCLKNMDGPLS